MSYEQPYQPPVVPVQQPAVKPPNSKLVFWTSGPGILSMLAIMLGLVIIAAGVVNVLAGPAGDNFDVAVTSCKGETGDLPSATVGFTVTNTSNRTRSATLKIEYRDGAGSRIDTDTSYVRDIKPGDTVRSEESTLLDAAPDTSMRCEIVGVS